MRESYDNTKRPLPTRIIDIESFRDSFFNALKLARGRRHHKTSSVRLITPSPGKTGEYVALSHRWGETRELTLNLSSAASLRRGISFNSLPRMYQDAVLTTMRLGFRLLWVDALCIIQDDERDWLIESARMQDVFTNAACTIAAHSPLCDDDEFLGKRSQRPMENERQASGSASPDLVFKMPHSSFRHEVNGSHLSRRGWVFQERILSPRILHVGKGSVFFEDEGGVQFADPGDGYSGSYCPWRDKSRTISEMADTTADWYKVVEDYTKCSLTYERDRLPALAGLVKSTYLRFGDRNTATYCAGLWSDTVYIGLLWSARNTTLEPLSDDDSDVPPSWSWGHWKGAIQYPKHFPGLSSRLKSVALPEAMGEDKPSVYLGLLAAKRRDSGPSLYPNSDLQLRGPCSSLEGYEVTPPGFFSKHADLDRSLRFSSAARSIVRREINGLDSFRGIACLRQTTTGARLTCVGGVSLDGDTGGEADISDCTCVHVANWRNETTMCFDDDSVQTFVETADFVLLVRKDKTDGSLRRIGMGVVNDGVWISSFEERSLMLL